jgi:cytochrome c oxidase cbb3-type subunit III
MKARINRPIAFACAVAAPLLSAAGTEASDVPAEDGSPLFVTLLTVIILLAIMIMALGSALRNLIGSNLFSDRLRENKEKENSNSRHKSVTIIAVMSLLTFTMKANNSVQRSISTIAGLDAPIFYTMCSVISVELLVLYIIYRTFKKVLHTIDPPVIKNAQPVKKGRSIIEKLNDTVEIEQEDDILLDHEYDGIRELDNNLPPWWKYGFYLTILVSVVYLVNYHVAHLSPLQAEEYRNSMTKAEQEIAEYMKTSANNVDESSVKLLTDAADLAAGKEIFINNCSACHGREGEGTVGPNLTDEYWLHSGGVSDIFKTIKYGWPDKGMKGWKEDLSPVQIAQVTSFIRSLKGTSPAKPKEKQGEIYIETSDSAAVRTDAPENLTSALLKNK